MSAVLDDATPRAEPSDGAGPIGVLRVDATRGKPQAYPLTAATLSIGRAEDADVQLSGWNVARQHARLFVHARDVFIEDQGSLFGTWVNGDRITRHGPLSADDDIMIGGHRLRLMVASTRTEAAAHDRAADASGAPAPGHADPQVSEAMPREAPPARVGDVIAHHQQILHRVLLERLELQRVDVNRMDDEVLRSNVRAMIHEILAEAQDLPATLDREHLAKRLLDETLGLGPLEDLLADPGINEIMVNRFDEIWIERGGRLQRSEARFTSDRAVLGAIERIVTPLGRRIDESAPMVDARLRDGSRVNAVIGPLSLRGPSLTIRKFPTSRMAPRDLLRHGALSEPMLELLALAMRRRLNIVVSGGTGSGKTTFLNMLSSYIPDDERIVTIEDAAELSLAQPNLVALECRPPNVEGKGEVTARDLLRNALRMRPDRIVVGECRGGEALDMLQAMNTGHDGSLTTLHANTARDALARLELLVMMSGLQVAPASVREQIASAVDLLVQLVRMPCGRRVVSQITEVTGSADGVIQVQDLFVFQRTAADAAGLAQGHFRATGSVPEFVQAMQAEGARVDLAMLGDASAMARSDAHAPAPR